MDLAVLPQTGCAALPPSSTSLGDKAGTALGRARDLPAWPQIMAICYRPAAPGEAPNSQNSDSTVNCRIVPNEPPNQSAADDLIRELFDCYCRISALAHSTHTDDQPVKELSSEEWQAQ